MAVVVNQTEQIVTLAAGDTHSEDRLAVQSIILRGTAAGTFVISLGNTVMSIDNSANALTVQLDIRRRVNRLTLTSGPAGAVMYALLEQKM